MMFSVLEIKKIVEALEVSQGADKIIESFSWDTRDLQPGSCFIALKGDKHDAHSFIDDSVVKAMGVAIVSNKGTYSDYKDKTCMILVEDTLVALQKIATAWRDKLDTKVIGITGSNGKTSTKEFLATILSESFECHYSKGSFNNHWGVPFSILSAKRSTEVMVLEMGMSAPNEIKELCEISRPDIVGVTNVGTSHIGFFKDQDGIAKAKSEIYQSENYQSAVYNLDNSFTQKMYGQFSNNKKAITISSKDSEADVFLQIISTSENAMDLAGVIGGVESKVTVKVFGSHHVYNIMMAAGLALATGMAANKVWQGIGKCKTIWGRSEWRGSKKGYKILFDAYNSNLESVEALIESVSSLEKEKFLVIGEMKELGEHSNEAHKRLGQLVAKANFSGIWYLGNYLKEFKEGLGELPKNLINSNTYNESLAIEFQSMLSTNDIVLVKGSRALKLEKISDFLQA